MIYLKKFVGSDFEKFNKKTKKKPFFWFIFFIKFFFVVLHLKNSVYIYSMCKTAFMILFNILFGFMISFFIVLFMIYKSIAFTLVCSKPNKINFLKLIL